jgi:hypothetical protein
VYQFLDDRLMDGWARVFAEVEIETRINDANEQQARPFLQHTLSILSGVF